MCSVAAAAARADAATRAAAVPVGMCCVARCPAHSLLAACAGARAADEAMEDEAPGAVGRRGFTIRV